MKEEVSFFFFFKKKTAYEIGQGLEFRRVLVRSDDRTIGFVVPQVLDLELYNLQRQQPPDPQLFPASLMPFLSGYFIGDENDISIAIDVPSVFSALQQGD